MDSEEELLFVSSSESSTDEEWEERLIEVEQQKQRDAAHDALWDLYRKYDIDSKLNGLIDAQVINTWLKGAVSMEDVVIGNHLKKTNSTVLGPEISQNRIDEIREVAKATVQFFRPGFVRFKPYIDDVCASILVYHYKL